ncbi:MAG TPA: discoidin domain-containing protein [Polyangiaceae bacterium]|nr:discoidin domain-containing protein [Polyangiaceae bacterium]
MVFLERARVAAELAERARRPSDPLPGGGGVATACELYRQSIHWALRAHREVGRNAPEPELPAATTSTLWDEADRALLERAAGGSEALARLRSELVDRSFVDFAELSERRQDELAEAARAFSQVLLEALEPERKKAERLWFRRALFFACGIAVVATGIFLTRAALAWREARRDLAALAPWTTSSLYAVGGCPSPRQECPESPNYFFHTYMENDPWIIFDLGKVKRTSSIVVRNRVDCCADRPVPLVVELSTDKKNWTIVARQTSAFDVWRASYAKTRARYVKLHVPKPDGILHLKSVRVLP